MFASGIGKFNIWEIRLCYHFSCYQLDEVCIYRSIEGERRKKESKFWFISVRLDFYLLDIFIVGIENVGQIDNHYLSLGAIVKNRYRSKDLWLIMTDCKTNSSTVCSTVIALRKVVSQSVRKMDSLSFIIKIRFVVRVIIGNYER